MHRRYPKYGSPSQMQSQELVPIQDRPNLYLDTAQPRVPQDFWHCSAADLLHFLYLCLAFEPLILLEEGGASEDGSLSKLEIGRTLIEIRDRALTERRHGLLPSILQVGLHRKHVKVGKNTSHPLTSAPTQRSTTFHVQSHCFV